MKADEIIGSWENGADDGSGLHGIWGWRIDFFEDGTGEMVSWGMWDDDRGTTEIRWERVGTSKISLVAIYKDSE